MAVPELFPQLTTTPATPSDAAAISSIGRETFRITAGHATPEEDMKSYLDATYTPAILSSDISDPDNTFIVVRERTTPHDDERIIGFTLLKRNTTEPFLPTDIPLIELNRIYVSHKSHGRGAGKVLMEAADELARDQGFSGLWLGVWAENLGAQRFYERHGYRAVGKHDFVVGNDVQTDLVLLKRL